MRRSTPLAAVAALALVIALSSTAQGQPATSSLAPDNVQIYVGGRAVHFDFLALAHGEPVVSADDAGMRTMLELTGVRMQYQPGTRFVVFTRADGKLVTFTVGSNAVTVDDTSQGIPFGPFYDNDRLYVPLLELAQALGLNVRPFTGGYAFAPEIVSVTRLVGEKRTILQIAATAPLTWRTAYGGNAKKPALVVTFPGFFNAAGSELELGGREAREAVIAQQGPPAYPITTVTVEAARGVRFAAHRTASWSMDLVLSRDEKELALSTAATLPPSISLSASPQAQPAPVPPASSPQPVGSQPAAGGSVPTAVPMPQPAASGSQPPGGSPSPLASGELPSPPPIEKILDVSEADAPDVSRIILTLSGPVSFAWHRLAPPDNRFWVDISQAELVGAAQDVAVKLPVVRSVTISQNELTPDHVVRIAIDPTQPLDVEIGAIEGAPSELGIDIHSSAPPPDAPASGVGALAGAQPTPVAYPVVFSTYVPADPRLIVIDPGHGGNDPGAINEAAGLTEKVLTLDISKRLRTDLEHAGWHVAMTRDGDYEVGDPSGNDQQELQARCDVANAAGARLFISVHINASVSSDPNGVTTYYWQPAARPLAQAVQAAVVSATGAHDAGTIRNNFYVIHHTMMPSILVEADYLSNTHDAALLAQQWFLDRIADGISRGVQAFTGGPPAQ